MFDTRTVDRTAGGGFQVLKPGTYTARVEEAKQVATDYAEQLEVSFKVKYEGRYVPLRQWLTYEQADGEETDKVRIDRRVITELAEACNAVNPKNGHPVPRSMAGNIVELVVSRYTVKRGANKGKERNGLDEVRVPGAAKEAPEPELPAGVHTMEQRGRYAEERPPFDDPVGGPDPDADIPW